MDGIYIGYSETVLFSNASKQPCLTSEKYLVIHICIKEPPEMDFLNGILSGFPHYPIYSRPPKEHNAMRYFLVDRWKENGEAPLHPHQGLNVSNQILKHKTDKACHTMQMCLGSVLNMFIYFFRVLCFPPFINPQKSLDCLGWISSYCFQSRGRDSSFSPSTTPVLVLLQLFKKKFMLVLFIIIQTIIA